MTNDSISTGTEIMEENAEESQSWDSDYSRRRFPLSQIGVLAPSSLANFEVFSTRDREDSSGKWERQQSFDMTSNTGDLEHLANSTSGLSAGGPVIEELEEGGHAFTSTDERTRELRYLAQDSSDGSAIHSDFTNIIQRQAEVPEWRERNTTESDSSSTGYSPSPRTVRQFIREITQTVTRSTGTDNSMSSIQKEVYLRQTLPLFPR
jgi:hypothetical protein